MKIYQNKPIVML